MTSFLNRKIKEFRKKFINDHNIGEERFLRGLFIEDFEAFLTQTIKECQQKTTMRVENIVYSCLYKEWVERGFPENFEAGEINISRFSKTIQSLKETEGKE